MKQERERDDPAFPSSQQVDDGDKNGGGPLPTLSEVLACQINEWYPAFAKEEEEEEELDDQGDVACNDEDGAVARRRQRRRRSRQRRKKITIPTLLLPLPNDFVSFLRQERNGGGTEHRAVGLRLPRGAQTSSTLWRSSNGGGSGVDDASDQWSSDSENNDDNARHVTTALQGRDGNDNDQVLPDNDGNDCAFPELDHQIKGAIHQLGGTVAPKLNWSAPKDATWLPLNGTLACRTPGDVYLLLQSSDFVAYDLDHALVDVQLQSSPLPPTSPPTPTPPPLSTPEDAPHTSFYLALRKWCNLHPSREFRCFVRDHRLVAVSQRHHSQHYPHLRNDRSHHRQLLYRCFRNHIQHRYACGQVSRYVFDAYIDKRNRVWLLDFNVWGKRTDPLLFSWNELERLEDVSKVEEEEDDECDDTTDDDSDSEEEDDNDGHDNRRGDFELRVVETAHEIRGDPLASYRAPIDAVHVASWTGAAGGSGSIGAGSAFEAFRQMCVAPSELDGDEDEETDSET